MEPKQQPPYPLRMPQELREELEKEAALGKRSLNAEVVMRLQLSLARQQELYADLRAKKRVVTRQILEREADLMGAEEILLLRNARLDAQRSKKPSENQLAPLLDSVSQAERVVAGFKELLNELCGRLIQVDEQLARAMEHDKQLGFGDFAE